MHADTHTHTHWEGEARPPAGTGGCHGALKEVSARDGRSPAHLEVWFRGGNEKHLANVTFGGIWAAFKYLLLHPFPWSLALNPQNLPLPGISPPPPLVLWPRLRRPAGSASSRQTPPDVLALRPLELLLRPR